MKKPITFIFASILLLSMHLPLMADQLSGRDVMVMVDEREDGDNKKNINEMILINRRGKQRVREVISISIDIDKDSKKMIFFRKPYDVKGTSFLSWEYDDPQKQDDKWLYMPALRKTKRISGDSENDYFMGTDFTYDDLGDRNVDEDAHKLLREENLNGCNCYVVESIPVDEGSYYTKKISWVRKDAKLPIKCEYYDNEGLLKTFKATKVELIEGFWTSIVIEMENHRENHKTIMKTKEIKYNTDVEESLFTVSYIKRGLVR